MGADRRRRDPQPARAHQVDALRRLLPRGGARLRVLTRHGRTAGRSTSSPAPAGCSPCATPASDGTQVDLEEVAPPLRAAARRSTASTEQGFLLWAIFDVIVDRYFDVTDRSTTASTTSRRRCSPTARRARRRRPREIFALRSDLTRCARAAAPLREVRRRDHPQGGRVRRRRGDRALPGRLRPHAARRSTSSSRSATCSPACSRPNLAVTSNQMNQVMKKMSSWGAILIVATLIAGIYGMNFRHMPELRLAVRLPVRARPDGDHDVRALAHLQAEGLALASASSSAGSSSTISSRVAPVPDHAAESPPDLEQHDRDPGDDRRFDEHSAGGSCTA